jgi:DNA-binding NtrC family response regulator
MQNFLQFVGSSSFAVGLSSLLQRLAPLDATVIICGDTGTGKSIVAELLHEYSNRKPLVTLDCTTTPEALFESELFGSRKGAFTGAADIGGMVSKAASGTLWFEEIGDLTLACQTKLLRLLDGKYRPIGAREDLSLQARIICTTNRDLKGMVDEKKFRADLFYRLEELQITIPPLHQRPEDVLPLLQHYVDTCELNPKGKIPLEVHENSLSFLKRYAWPGNVRQLKNMVKRAFAEGYYKEAISTDDIATVLSKAEEGSRSSESGSLKTVAMVGGTLAEIEQRAIRSTLEELKWSIPQAAARLGVSPKILQGRMRSHGLEVAKAGDEALG